MYLNSLILGLISSHFVMVFSAAQETSNYVMSNTSELRKHDQLEDLANQMFDEYWQMTLLNNPEKATTLGDHRYDDKLTSYSLKAYEKQKVMLNEFLERANQMLPLAPEGCIVQNNLELFIANLQNQLDELMSGSYLFPESNLWTYEMSARFLLKYMKTENANQYWNIIMRYRGMETQIDEKIELMREGIRTNFTLSNYSLPSGHRNFRIQSIEESPFYKPFLNISSTVSSDEAFIIQRNASDAILNYLVPALEKLNDFMQNEYRLSARLNIGVSSLPNGKEFYKQRLAFHLADNNVTAAQIHDMGLAEVARISLEMDKVIRLLGFNFSCQEFNDYLRNDESLHFNSEEEALETYRDVLENVISPTLLKVFKRIPRAKLEVQGVPKELASGPLAYYLAPSPDNSTPGIFFLDATNPTNLPRYDVMTLSLHEGVPGHHFQEAFLMEEENLPDFRKYGIENSAYMEGWALYAEYLGYELGLFEDLYQHFGHLSLEMFRACRLVVDTGIHVMGWTRDQAISYMSGHIALSINEIEREVDRYITWPGQACAYKYGELKIKQLRKKSEDSLGENFDIREFHDTILRNKAPFAILENEIDRYISANREQA